MTDNSSRKRDPLAMPTPVIDINDDHWLAREMRYWEQISERLRTQLQELQKSHDTWKSAHEALLKQVRQWEEWYKSLEKDRDLYKQWDADKKAETERLNSLIHHWESEHGKVVAHIEEFSKEIQQERATLDDENKHMTEVIHQWEGWYKGLEEEMQKQYRNPFRYLRGVFGMLFKPKK